MQEHGCGAQNLNGACPMFVNIAVLQGSRLHTALLRPASGADSGRLRICTLLLTLYTQFSVQFVMQISSRTIWTADWSVAPLSCIGA
jgi:hypothetical protein